MPTKLQAQYPELTEFFTLNAKNVATPEWDWDAAICEALDSIENLGDYELGPAETFTGRPVIYSEEGATITVSLRGYGSKDNVETDLATALDEYNAKYGTALWVNW